MSKHGLIAKVETALDSIRPYLQADGGDVKVVSVKKGVVELELLGNCETCPMSSMTLTAGVEEAIKKALPEIIKVKAVNLTDSQSSAV